jgi:hypothetical protein
MTILCSSGLAQSLAGRVTNETNNPIPYTHIFIRELESGTTTDERGITFLLLTLVFAPQYSSKVIFSRER